MSPDTVERRPTSRCITGVKAVAIIALAGTLALVPEAYGKGCARITTTAPVVAGTPVRITLTTMLPSYAPDGSLRKLTPNPLGASVPMSVFATPQFGPAALITLRRSRVDRSKWSARFAFPRPGSWWLTSTMLPDGLPDSCSGRKLIRVGKRG
jgi:hypothetical protein